MMGANMARKSSASKNKRILAIIALILAVLLIVTSVFYSFATGLAEEASRNQYELDMEYFADEQALHIRQRLVFHNDTGAELDSVVFYAAANVFRRQSKCEDIFPNGYMPGGMELGMVLVNGEPAEWGMTDEEMFLRVYVALMPDETCEFEFAYMLLLTENEGFLGMDKDTVRLSGFYIAPCVYDGGYLMTEPLSYTHWMYTENADYHATLTLPKEYTVCGTGTAECRDGVWQMDAENVCEFALLFSKERKEYSEGIVRVYASGGSDGKRIRKYAEDALALCREWFGEYPYAELEIVQCGYASEGWSEAGMAWVSDAVSGDALAHEIYFMTAQQYFGLSSRGEPVSDAWLSDAVCEWIAYCMTGAMRGEDAMLEQMRKNILPSLQITVPGNLYVTSDAGLFAGSAEEYEMVVVDRGAGILHQLAQVMGREDFLLGLRNFYERGRNGEILTEMDFVEAVNAADGGNWQNFLEDWIFHLSDYTVNTERWFD